MRSPRLNARSTVADGAPGARTEALAKALAPLGGHEETRSNVARYLARADAPTREAIARELLGEAAPNGNGSSAPESDATASQAFHDLRLLGLDLQGLALAGKPTRQVRAILRGIQGKAIELETELDPATEIAVRTLAAVDDAPPQDLELGMFEPEGPTCIYGPGGTGKGSTVAWTVAERLKLGRRSLIYDPENRPKEWARRLSGLGVDRSDVPYLQPKDLPRGLLGQPLWGVAPYLGKYAAAAGADRIYIDSILAGMNIGEDRLKADAQAPYLYVSAMDALGIPSVSIGHTPRGTPEGDPYGSVSWVNAMRLTWLGNLAEGEGHHVRWRPRKRNERGHIPAFLLHFSYEGNTLRSVTRSDDEENTREWLKAALRAAPRTVEELAEELVEEMEDPSPAALERAKARLRQALARMKREKLAAKVGEKRGSPWKLVDDWRLVDLSRRGERDQG